MTETVLIIAAHPDDEVLGVGGTAARHIAEHDDVHVLIMAEGATSRDDKRDKKKRETEMTSLRKAAMGAAAVLGIAEPEFAGFPDNRLDEIALLDVIKVIEDKVAKLGPTVVYTHFSGDLNIDHQVVHRAVVTACRPLPGSTVKAIYAFETVSSTEWTVERSFRPVRFVDIELYLEKKIKALDCYHLEMRPAPHARSLKAVSSLAVVRGGQNGCNAAEAFEVVRESL